MKQSKVDSVLEALTNIAIGAGIALIAQYLVGSEDILTVGRVVRVAFD